MIQYFIFSDTYVSVVILYQLIFDETHKLLTIRFSNDDIIKFVMLQFDVLFNNTTESSIWGYNLGFIGPLWNNLTLAFFFFYIPFNSSTNWFSFRRPKFQIPKLHPYEWRRGFTHAVRFGRLDSYTVGLARLYKAPLQHPPLSFSSDNSLPAAASQ